MESFARQLPLGGSVVFRFHNSDSTGFSFFRNILQSDYSEGARFLNSIHDVMFLVTPMVFLLLLSGFFSGTETALFSLSAEGARQLSRRHRTATLLRILRQEPDELLTAILFGNLLVNILFFCTGAAASGRLAEGRGGWFDALGAVLILFSVVLFGEIVPKAIGIAHPRAVLLFSASPLNVWFSLTKPFRCFIAFLLRVFRLKTSASPVQACLTQGELRELLDAVRPEAGFGAQEKEVLEDILTLPDVRAREIMVPRMQVPRKSIEASREDILAEARRQRGAQVIICGEKEDDLLGYLSVKDLLLREKEESIESLLRPLGFIPETKRLDKLLREFLAGDWSLAAVVDEYGGFSGVVTVEDILSEVVGDVALDEMEEVSQLDSDTYRLSGQLSVRAWRELFVGVIPEQEVVGLAFDTLGGFIVSLLGRMPREGDHVAVRNLCLTVETVQRGRVLSVLLHLEQSGGQK